MVLTGFEALKEQMTRTILANDDSGLGNGPVTLIRRDGEQIQCTDVHVVVTSTIEGERGTVTEINTIRVQLMKVDLENVAPQVGEEVIWQGMTFACHPVLYEEGTHWWRFEAQRVDEQYRGGGAAAGGRGR